MAKSDIQLAIEAHELSNEQGLAGAAGGSPANFVLDAVSDTVVASHSTDYREIWIFNLHATDNAYMAVSGTAVTLKGIACPAGVTTKIPLAPGSALTGLGSDPTTVAIQVWTL